MLISQVFLILQASCTFSAIFLNSFLIYVILFYTRMDIGRYKYLMVAYAIFEMLYAIIVFIGMPVNFIADNSWIVFNYAGFIGGSPIATLGPTLYCSFYEVWIGFVVVHFVYRYVAVCRRKLQHKIRVRTDLQLLLFALYLIHFTYCFICGVYFCTRSEISLRMREKIQEEFHIRIAEPIGYILLRIRALDGNLSAGGIISIINHLCLVSFSVSIILFCAYNIQKEIRRMQKNCVNLRHLRLQRQIFTTLLIQSIVPIFLCHIPSLVYLTFPIWDKETTFGGISSIFSLLTAVPKVLDPIIVLCCIRDYTRAVRKIFGLVPIVSVVNTSHGITFVSSSMH